MSHRILHPRVAIISDLHVGSPENARLEDFDRDGDFHRLLLHEIPTRADDRPTTLVINGDFIDFPQILPELGKTCPAERVGVTERESLRRVHKAIAGHPTVFAALGAFVAAGNQVLLLPGNHDIDLCHPSVIAALRAAIGGQGATAFEFVAEGAIAEQGVYIEHGNQYSYDNWFEHWRDPIIACSGDVRRIERPWGTMFMDLVYNDIEELYPFVNKVQPAMALARIILRLVRTDPDAPVHAIAALLKFFVLRGKRMLWGHVLGKEGATAPGVGTSEPRAISRAEIEDTARELGMVMVGDRLTSVIDEVATALDATATTDSVEIRPAQSTEGLLGRTDERGLAERAQELLESGKVHVVAFGHTHDPEDRRVELSGRTGRVLNTGGWISRIVIPAGSTPSLAELEAAPRVHDLRYAWVELGAGLPTAILERLG